MKKIMYAGLNETLTENEYAWIESTEAEFGREWDGDVEGYLENSDIDLDEYRMVRGRAHHSQSSGRSHYP